MSDTDITNEIDHHIEARNGDASGPVRAIAFAALAGGAVAIALGTYGRVHTPTGDAIATFGFPAVLPMKAWFATGAALLALVQVVLALWMWGRLPRLGASTPPVAAAHRWVGTTAFLVTLPVAYHCLWSLGFQDSSARVLAHSILGCLFYGVFATKMLLLRADDTPSWTMPVAGGVLVAVLALIWTTSSLWFFTNFGVPGF